MLVDMSYYVVTSLYRAMQISLAPRIDIDHALGDVEVPDMRYA